MQYSNAIKRNRGNEFHAHMRGLALQTFIQKFQQTPTATLEDKLVVFRQKNVKHDSSASSK